MLFILCLYIIPYLIYDYAKLLNFIETGKIFKHY